MSTVRSPPRRQRPPLHASPLPSARPCTSSRCSTPPTRSQPGGFEPSLAADQIAADAAATLQRDVPGLSVVGQGVAGHKPAETLVTLAETLDAALIVVGTRRVKGLDACWAASRARSPPRPTATSTSRTRTTEPPAAPPLRDVITPGTWRHRG
nr:universal stress protein [Nocardioides daphniae]